VRKSQFISTCFVAILLLWFHEKGLTQVRPIKTAESILAIYTEDWGLFSSGGAKLVVGIWSDGHAVWSKDEVRGGPPYQGGHVAPAKFRDLLSRLKRDGVFADKRLSRAHFGPDSKFTVIYVRSGKQQLNMESWHELYEAGGGLVATSLGLEPLSGRNLEDVLRNEPKDYRNYRATWTRIRYLIWALLPKEGAPVQGVVRMKAGAVSWDEGPVEEEPSKSKRSTKVRIRKLSISLLKLRPPS